MWCFQVNFCPIKPIKTPLSGKKKHRNAVFLSFWPLRLAHDTHTVVDIVDAAGGSF